MKVQLIALLIAVAAVSCQSTSRKSEAKIKDGVIPNGLDFKCGDDLAFQVFKDQKAFVFSQRKALRPLMIDKGNCPFIVEDGSVLEVTCKSERHYGPTLLSFALSKNLDAIATGDNIDIEADFSDAEGFRSSLERSCSVGHAVW